MKNTWNNLDRIESWKYNEMDADAKAQFEKDMRSDSNLVDDIHTYKNIIEHIERFGNERSRKAILKVEQKLERDGFFGDSAEGVVRTIKKGYSLKKILSMAASVAVLIMMTWFVFSPGKEFPVSEMANLKLEKENLALVFSKLNVDPLGDKEKGKKDSLAAALQLLKKDEYVKARIAILQYLDSYPEDYTAQLYLGIAYVHDAKYAKGAKYLMPLTRLTEGEDRDLAKWYAAMCYTQFKNELDLETAKSLLKELADDPASRFYDPAKSYLDLLNK